MSVINQMLKDLEARQRSGAAPGRVQAAIAGSASAGRGTGRAGGVMLVVAVGLLVAVAGGIGWVVASLGADADGREVAPAPTAEPAAGPAPPAATSAPVAQAAATNTPIETAPSAMTEVVPPPSVEPAAPATLAAPTDPAAAAAPAAPAAAAPAAPAAAAPAAPAAAAPAAPVAAAPDPPARQTLVRLPPPGDPLEDVRALLADGRASEALARLDAASSASPEASALRATALQALGRHRDAILAWTAALDRQPDIAPWWVGLAISLEAEGRAHEALAAYARAGRHGPLEPALADYLRGRVDALSAPSAR
ncbi:MAG: hypothetical protein ACK5US_13825 [Lysobacteraceae bacterium]